MAREIKRDYQATPELLKDGIQLPPVPTQPDDWIATQRLLTALRNGVTGSGGTITERTYRTAVSPDGRVEIDTDHGIRIYDDNNVLIAQFDGSALTITGGTITGGTIQTALSPNARLELTTANGLRVFNSTNTVVAQLVQTLTGGSYFTVTEATVSSNLRTNSIISAAGSGTAISIATGVGATFGGSAEVLPDGSGVLGKVTLLSDGTARVTVTSSAVTIAPPIVGSNTTDSTTSITGAWKTAGGLGVAKALNVGTNITAVGVVISTGAGFYIGGATATDVLLTRSGGRFYIVLGNNSAAADVSLNDIYGREAHFSGNIDAINVTGNLVQAGNQFTPVALQYLDWTATPQTMNVWQVV